MPKKLEKIKKKKIVKKIAKKKPVKKARKKTAEKSIELEKFARNPIVVPSFYSWESKATFNPTAFISDGKIYMIYRAIGEDDSSVLGYAGSDDGFNITERSKYFIYKRYGEFVRSGAPINYASGGGWGGGCEDPRVTLLGDRLYMIYTAFDGWGSLRMALTSIKLNDFKNKKWNWEKPVLISPPNEIHKNWVIFPEKINGKYAILHSISPEISIEYVDSLEEFDGNKFIKSHYDGNSSWDDSWHSSVRGVGPAPIKTDLGWLVLYHAMDKNDPDKYKLGAMILDAGNPNEILYASRNPILEPEEYYENTGYKSGVIYSCGAVVKDGVLLVYYGGADKVACVASIKLQILLDNLKQNKIIKLKKERLLEI